MLLANEKTPVLAITIPALEMMMTTWENMKVAPRSRHLAPYIEKGLAKAREYYVRMDNTRAYNMNMRKLEVESDTPFADVLPSPRHVDQGQVGAETLGPGVYRELRTCDQRDREFSRFVLTLTH